MELQARTRCFLDSRLDFEQLVNAIIRRVQEKDSPSQVKQVGEYYLQLPEFSRNVAVVGSSGSGRSTTLRRIIDGIASKAGSKKIIVIDQKGEHRGLAWKYGWKVFSFASDSQAQEFQVSFFSGVDSETAAYLGADLIQEWFNQGSLNCSDQQKERVASIIRSQTGANLNLVAVTNLMSQEPDLAELAQKLKKGLLSRSTFSRIFSDKSSRSNFDQSIDLRYIWSRTERSYYERRSTNHLGNPASRAG